MHTTDPLRCVLLVDSRAAAGAWAKGRSSARNLNRILHQALAWSLLGRKSLHLVWVRSEANPADYPSRNKKIPPPTDNPDPITKLAFGGRLEAHRHRRSNRDIWRAVEKGAWKDSPTFEQHDPGRVSLAKTESAHSAHVPKTQAAEPPHPALGQWTFREIFAGSAHLTSVFRRI